MEKSGEYEKKRGENDEVGEKEGGKGKRRGR